MRSVGSWMVAVAALMVALAPSDAHAQRRVVVDSFGGPRGANTRAALIRDLEENGVVVVSDDEVDAAREELDLGRRLSGEDYVELGRALNVSAFIDGRVRRRRRRWAVTVTVRNAADGERVGRESWGGRTASSLRAVGRNGFDRLSEHLDATESPAAPVEVAAPPANETPWYSQQNEPERPPAWGEDPADEPAAPDNTRYDAFRVSVLAGSLYRWMDTTVQVYASQRGQCSGMPECAGMFLDEQRAYRGPGIGHFELGAEAEVYPGAFGDQPFPYIGGLVRFSHSIAPPAVGPSRDGSTTVAIPTNQLDFLVALRGRYRFGADRREPEVHVDVGWGMFNFNLGLPELQTIDPRYIVPPMEHGYVQLGAGVSYGIVPTYLTATLDFAYRIGTNIGANTRNVWGVDTGPANGMVIGLEVKSEIPEIVQGAFVALRFQYFQFTTAFRGQVGCASADGCASVPPWEDTQLWEVWPVTPPAAGAMYDINSVVGGPTGDVNDNYFRLQLALGYAFR